MDDTGFEISICIDTINVNILEAKIGNLVNKSEIKEFIDSFVGAQSRTIIIVDFGNVDKWKESLGWKIGIQELARLIKNFSIGNRELRRFYYGVDYGPYEKNKTPTIWSAQMIHRAEENGLKSVTKRVKYIHNSNNSMGYDKKCDLDVDMAIDLVKMKDSYDNVILFSGDGDLICATNYLKQEFSKKIYVFSARGHIGREVIDASKEKLVDLILYIEDFEYRLNMDRFRYK